MRRIATATRHLNKFGPGRDGFANGDPILGVPATDLEAEWFDALQEEIATLIEAAGLELNPANHMQLRQALHVIFASLDSPEFVGIPKAPTPGTGDNSNRLATTAFVSRILGSFPMMFSIVDVPTVNKGPIMIAEAGEMWLWVKTAYYEGYRSPSCGRPMIGHTPAPLINEVDATGGLLTKAAYPALWGYAREAGLVVSQAVWAANVGAYYFVDASSTQFRVPDLRDMHMRFTGTSAEGGPRTLGTKQMDAGQRLQGVLGAPQEIGINGVFAALPGTASQFAGSQTNAQAFSQVQLDTARTARVSSETRGINVAFHPRIHI
jgi:hypothetical protein